LSISLQFKIEKLLGGQPMLIFASDVWVTIQILTPANFIFVADRICWWEAFQVGSGSIKMYTKCTAVQNGGLVWTRILDFLPDTILK
jgi:hypothetical protein